MLLLLPHPLSHSCTLAVILCPQLSIVNGMIIMTSNTVGSLAFYQCNLGFEVSGLTVRECTADSGEGQWSGEEPTCIGIKLSNDHSLSILSLSMMTLI